MIITEKSVRNNKHCYSTENFVEIQKQRLMGELFEKSSQYYRDNCELSFGYTYDKNGIELAIAYWSIGNEQIN